MDALRGRLSQINKIEQDLVNRQHARSDQNRRTALIVAVASAAFSVVGILVGMLLLSRGLVRRIQLVEGRATELGAGTTLSETDPGRDEIGRLDSALYHASLLLLERDQARIAAIREANVATEEASRANTAKSEFLSRVSHELRTPLNAVLGFSQLLALKVTDPADRESVDLILQGGNHLLTLINEILDISAAEGGRMTLLIESIDVTDVLAEAVALMAPIAAQNDVVIGSVPAATDCVSADRHRLTQILLNLLANAVKYNRPEGTITFGVELPDADVVRILIHDTGIGISETQALNIFNPFERIGAERLLIEGTGLGLTLAKQLVEVMGGSIGLRSTAGVGSTFWIDLPASHSPATAPSVRPTMPSGPAGRQMTILYIEDNLSNMLLVERILGDSIARGEISLIPAQLGQLGLELGREHRPDLILLDLQLPDIPGAEVLRQLRLDPRTRSIPVAILTADARPDERERLLNAGAFAYLAKPIRVPELFRLVNRTVGTDQLNRD
jgi:signal transduction histidine kinase/CheY-like chemotaxis protein